MGLGRRILVDTVMQRAWCIVVLCHMVWRTVSARRVKSRSGGRCPRFSTTHVKHPGTRCKASPTAESDILCKMNFMRYHMTGQLHHHDRITGPWRSSQRRQEDRQISKQDGDWKTTTHRRQKTKLVETGLLGKLQHQKTWIE